MTRHDAPNHDPTRPRSAPAPRTLSALAHADPAAAVRKSADPAGPARAVYAMAQRAACLCALGDYEAIKEGVVHAACALVPGCEHAALLPPGARRCWHERASSSAVAAACCAAEESLAEGPAHLVLAGHRPARLDPAAHPRFARAAADLGVASVLAVPIAGRHDGVGALCLYAGTADAFDEDGELIVRAFAMHAAVALNAEDAEANLRTALASRDVIARAVGILMQRHRVLPDAAFEMLRQASQRAHVKLREVATWVHDTGADPDALLPGPQ